MIRRSRKARNGKSKSFAEWVIPFTTVTSAAAAVVATCVSYGSYQQSIKQAEISERSLKAANRNTEVAGLLTALRIACDNVESINSHFFANANFIYKTDFDMSHPGPPRDNNPWAILLSGPMEFPDPNRPEILADARALLNSGSDLMRRYELVELYLTEAEAKDAAAIDISAPFKDFADLGYSVMRQELSARDVLENITAAQVMCTSLPKTLAAWFRDSQSNKLDYVLKLDDLQFRWARRPLDLWLAPKRRGSSLEERDEDFERRASKWSYDPVRDGIFVRLPSPLHP
ncbi:hypothetical protein [Rhizobium sp. NXC24]|uniref:hypothetical protein n=1 Tax=Rhizobium sp. NXC24 TaxID=2048897 RepID=UPI000CDF3E9F|nr:hypothetical protein [Rhizobium sp. NXC24]AVA22782.1 hypothetical protein NXC24_CH03155 [Rhizobium sp. NXC24]